MFLVFSSGVVLGMIVTSFLKIFCFFKNNYYRSYALCAAGSPEKQGIVVKT